MVDFQKEYNDWAIKPGPILIDNINTFTKFYSNDETAPKQRIVHRGHGPVVVHPNDLEEALFWPYFAMKDNNFELPFIVFFFSFFLLPAYMPDSSALYVASAAYGVTAIEYGLVAAYNK